jgi:hypothetical protein
MRLKILAMIIVGLFVIVSGCNADSSIERSSGKDDHLSVNYPPKSALQYPEDQVIRKEFKVTTQWQLFSFEEPLQINRRGLMGLHLAVDQALYISTMDNHPLNPECNDPECSINIACLRRLSDGVIIRPEAILIGNNGVEIKVRPSGHLYPYFDKHIMTMALRTFKEVNSPPPPFPKGINSITAMRIRSTEPFLVRYIYWNVDRYPFYD